jgi:hypothetical protein
MDSLESSKVTPEQLALIKVSTVAAFAFLGLAWGSIFWVGLRRRLWLDAIRENFAAMIMFPISCGFSLVVVLILQATAGQLKFSFLGFEFEGASGPVVLWVLCFLAQMFGIWLLWNRPERPRRVPRETSPVTGTPGAPSPP